jgi:Domain of unknown function (DUF1929)/Calx-beta domain
MTPSTGRLLLGMLCLHCVSACSERGARTRLLDQAGVDSDGSADASVASDVRATGGSASEPISGQAFEGCAGTCGGSGDSTAEAVEAPAAGDGEAVEASAGSAPQAPQGATGDGEVGESDAGGDPEREPDTTTQQDFADVAAAACPGDTLTGTRYACTHDTNDPGFQSPAVLAGTIHDPSRFLRLAAVPPPGVYDHNAITFERTAPGAQPLLVADFDFRITPVEGRGRADGLGFAFLNTAVYPEGAVAPVATAEEPSFARSLGVGFDIYKYPNEGDIGNENILPTFSDSISIHYDGQVLAQLDVEKVSDMGNGLWHHARIVLQQADSGAKLGIWLTPPCGESYPIVENYLIPNAAPFEARAWLGARAGGEAANHDVANVRVNFMPLGESWVSFGSRRYDADESQGLVALEVQREGDASGALSVRYETRDGSAIAGSDYQATSGTLTFGPGVTRQTLVIPLIDDALDESRLLPVVGRGELAPDVSESFEVALTEASAGGKVAGPALTEVVVNDDEGGRKYGHWGAPMCWRIIAMHAHVLPQTGNVLYWDRLGNVAEWSPKTGASSLIEGPGYDLFCAGHALLPDGRLLVAGGHDDPFGASMGHDGVGVDNLGVFDPAQLARGAQPWQALPAMSAPRWYPTVTALSNGSALLISGSLDVDYAKNFLPEVYDPALGTLRELTGAMDAAPHGAQLYPWMFALPNEQVAKVGPDPDAWVLDARGAGAWTAGPLRQGGQLLDYGSAVMVERRALVFGGGGADPAGHGPANVAAELDLEAPAAAWRNLPAMTIARRQHNATVLPDGRVFVSGGSSAGGFSNRSGAAYPAEMFADDAWSLLPAAAIPRLYHSSSSLLPDGRVVTGGGGEGAGATSFESNAEIYYPDYWYKPRPTLIGAPTELVYDVPFDLASSAEIDRVTAIRMSSVTHSFDQNQRLSELAYTRTASGVSVVIPSDGWVPPGHYLLFVLDAAGVPSLGATVHVDK